MVCAEYLLGVVNLTVDWGWFCTTGATGPFTCLCFFNSLDTGNLFASQLHCKLPQVFRWKPDPDAEAVDAFLQSSLDLKCYAFQPFVMIFRNLVQIRQQKATQVLLTLLWTAQVWYLQS